MAAYHEAWQEATGDPLDELGPASPPPGGDVILERYREALARLASA